ncbi:MAG: CRISPR-associated protein Cas4 [Acidobacteriota bacterium]
MSEDAHLRRGGPPGLDPGASASLDGRRPLPMSALQHLVFCERQAALIHVERQWADNVLTVEGHLLHKNVDTAARRSEKRGDLLITRGVALRSRRLGLVGVADVVEWHRDGSGVPVPGFSDRWRPQPVEYKRGRPKKGGADRVQLCAQAVALEEMLEVEIGGGALYYGQARRRTEVAFDEALRSQTREAALRLHAIIEARLTPLAHREPKCAKCSLVDLCLPGALDRPGVDDYLRTLF